MATELQRDNFRLDLGDAGSSFTDAEIDQLFIRSEAMWPGGIEPGARVLGIKQLMAKSSKLVDYRQNASDEKLSQIMKNLEMLRGIYQKELDDAVYDASGPQLRWGGGRRKPTRLKDYPGA